MIVIPSTKVRLLSNVPLFHTNEHQRKFLTKEAQTAYFTAKQKYEFLDFTYQREDQAIKVPKLYDHIYDCNYVMYQNSDFGSKWFYAFITKKEYVNPNTTRIFIELDVWQTWQFDITFQDSFIEREHTNRWNPDGSPVINTVPEGLDIGTEYDVIGNEIYEGGTTNYYLLTSTCSLVDAFKRADIPKNPPLPTPKVVQGLITGLDFYLFSDKDIDDFNPEDVNAGAGTWEGQTKNISASVESYRSAMFTACVNNGINTLVDLMLAMMQVESGGSGTDPMQSNEYATANGGTVTTPEESMDWACKLMKNNVELQVKYGTDIWSAVQAYNFGSAYIRYVSNNGKIHTTDLAESYSRDVVAPSLGNTTGEKTSYYNDVSRADGRTYRYVNGGNFHYVGLVKQYFEPATTTLGMPVPSSSVVTSWYMPPDRPDHYGIDFADDLNTPIYASNDGTVVYAQYNDGGFGNYVVIDHGNGMFTGYAHLNSINVSINEEVFRGERIGAMGSTGDSTGVHLHFNVSDGLFGNYQDPAPLLGLEE